MALPTLRPQWVKTFRNPVELTARRVERQEENRDKWSNHYKYFKSTEVVASKNKAWTSEGSYKKSMNAVDKIFCKAVEDEQKDDLDSRRQKLRMLLAEENKQYQVELRKMKQYPSSSFTSMQQRIDELQVEKEKQRKRVADEKLYEHWRKNQPRLREMESTRNKQLIASSWKDQTTERKEVKKSERADEIRYEELVKAQNELALQEELEKEKQLSERNHKIADELREQMIELRKKEERSEMLKLEEEKLRLHEQAVNEAETKRRAYDNQRKKQDFGRILIRQYKQQLKRKSKEVQEALKLDLEILNDLAEKEREDDLIKTSRREKLKADAQYMQHVVGEQLRLEKIREAEVDVMFQDEASRQWRKREGEWERERLARERLMEGVLNERQQQIQQKMDRLHEEQKESLKERELLLQRMEQHQQFTYREDYEKVTKKKERDEEIRQQISARETERERMTRREEEELLRSRQEDDQHELFLQHEAAKLNNQDTLSQPSFRRKRVAFM